MLLVLVMSVPLRYVGGLKRRSSICVPVLAARRVFQSANLPLMSAPRACSPPAPTPSNAGRAAADPTRQGGRSRGSRHECTLRLRGLEGLSISCPPVRRL